MAAGGSTSSRATVCSTSRPAIAQDAVVAQEPPGPCARGCGPVDEVVGQLRLDRRRRAAGAAAPARDDAEQRAAQRGDALARGAGDAEDTRLAASVAQHLARRLLPSPARDRGAERVDQRARRRPGGSRSSLFRTTSCGQRRRGPAPCSTSSWWIVAKRRAAVGEHLVGRRARPRRRASAPGRARGGRGTRARARRPGRRPRAAPGRRPR